MHEHKLQEFNPLDLLATAASLQCPPTVREATVDKTPTSPQSVCEEENTSDMTNNSSGPRRTRSTGSITNTTDNSKLKNMKLDSDLKIYQVVVKNELSKMLEEHNYGHPKRNFRYILHDEPFSSEERDSDLKMMDSNCNEFRDCVEKSPQDIVLSTPELAINKTSDNNADNRSPVVVPNDTKETVEKADKVEHASVESSEKNGLCSLVSNLSSVPECTGVKSVARDADIKVEQSVDNFPDDHQVDKIESCEDDQTLIDVETVCESKVVDKDTPGKAECDNSQTDSNTLEGFIISDPCQSGISGNNLQDKNPVKKTDEVIPGGEEKIQGKSSASLLASNMAGNLKKQTIIRSLLTGETIVVVQKSPNGSKDLGKIPLLVGSSQVKGNVKINSEDTPLCIQSLSNEHINVQLTGQQKVADNIEPLIISNKSSMEATDIEMARQQNKINSEILAGKSCMVISPEKSVPPISVTTLLPVTVNALNGDKISLQPSVQNALISKLSNERSQHKPIAPSSSQHSNLGQFNIGQFGSVSSSKIGLVKVNKTAKIVPSKTNGVSGGRKRAYSKTTTYDNDAYEQVMKKFPNLAKAYKDDDLLRMAVAPDEVLQCLPTSQSKSASKDHVFHDHDYCLKGPTDKDMSSNGLAEPHLPDIDREPKLGRPPKNADRRKKVPASRKNTSDCGNRSKSPPVESVPSGTKLPPELKLECEVKPPSSKRRSSRQKSTRDVSPSDSIDSPEMDGQGDGAKVKITGAFQDDFVYFINKTSRNRRRASEKPAPPVLPLPQASDIYIPHLSDADIAALKTKALAGGTTAAGPTNINDEDSNVVNTILSMECYLPNFDFPTNGTNGASLNGLDLTPEQMNILFSAIDEANTDPTVENYVETKAVEGSVDSVTKNGVSSPVKVPSPCETNDNTIDSGAQLLGNVDNIQISNMDLILKDAPSMKSYLPTLDISEVQDSISAISTTTTGPGIESVATVSSSSTVTESDQPSRKPEPVNGMSDLALPFEKSLDFLEVGEIKTELFPEVGLSVSPASTATPPPTPVASEAHSPWIVTVSMYWNDLPAVMLANLPYVRLVDIYKQILPAKDTGILKKRCQLLGIEVKNCSEMHRYFLVKYGRGYNSKSTLVISKDDAMSLIAFYVEPQTRAAMLKGGVEKAPQSPTPKSRKIIRRDTSSPILNGSSPDRPKNESESPVPEPLVAKKEKPKRSNPRSPSKRRIVVLPDGESVSKRLRHKKINFRNMVQGIKRDEVLEAEASVLPSESDPIVDSTALPTLPSTESMEGASPVDSEVPSVPSPQPIQLNNQQTHRQRSISRNSPKTARQHPIGIVKARSLRSFNSLNKQFRRSKCNFHNVLKKRQLNIAVQKSLKADLKSGSDGREKSLSDTVAIDTSGQSLPVLRASPRRRLSASLAANDRVRSSGRKRKIKQLYPIENYSYTKKPRKGLTVDIQSATEAIVHQSRPHIPQPLRTSPRKKRAETASRLDSVGESVLSPRSSEDEENRPKNVITLTNGPEFETFTALSGDY